MRIKIILSLVLFSSVVLYFLFIYVFNREHFQFFSVITEILTLLFLLAIPVEETASEGLSLPTRYYIYFVLFNAVVSVLNLWMLYNATDFSSASNQSEIDVKQVSLISGSVFIILGQVGGWVLQGVLVYLLGIYFFKDLSFSKSLRYLGTSYIGFLTGSLMLLVYNAIYTPFFNSLQEFKEYFQSSTSNLVIAKFGEYLTLLLLCLIFYNETKDFKKSAIIAYCPNIILMSAYLGIGHFI